MVDSGGPLHDCENLEQDSANHDTCNHPDDSIHERDENQCSVQSVPVVGEVVVLAQEEPVGHGLHDHLHGEHAAEQGVARTQDASLPRPGNFLVNINTGKTFPTLTKVGWWVSPQLR